MINKPTDIGEIHQKFDNLINKNNVNTEKSKFPYEFLASVDKGWILCDILEVDSNKELVKIIFHHPDGEGWGDITGAAGRYEEVVEMWRVRLREY